MVALALAGTLTSGAPAAAGGAATRPTTAAGDTLLTEPQQGFQPVDDFIRNARQSVDMTMYELADPVAESALAADAHRGVDVRVILNQASTGRRVNGPAFLYLVRNGVHVVWASSDALTHQKTITVDRRRSLILTANLVAADEATSRDFGVFDTDRADVSAIEATFAADFAGHRPGPAAPGADLVWSPGSQAALVGLIASARHSLTVENEEMDSAPITAALERAARRGVRVDLTMTYSASWTSALNALSAAGVKIHLYHGERPIYIHAKVISVDAGTPAQRAFIGSENFSDRSLRDNRELGVVTADPALLASLNATLASDFAGTPAA